MLTYTRIHKSVHSDLLVDSPYAIYGSGTDAGFHHRATRQATAEMNPMERYQI